jgi:uncharacterized protein (DUF433 family)
MNKDYRDIITIEPGKKAGKACIRGLRFMVADVLGYLAAGMSPDEIIKEWPDLTLEDIKASLEFAANNEEHRTYALQK